MKDRSLARIGGISGFAVAALSIIYAVAYLIISPMEQRGSDVAAYYTSFAANPTGRQLASLCFLASGIVGTFVIAGVSERLRALSAGWAGWSLVVGIVAMLATGIHGLYNLIVIPIQANLYNSGDAATKAAITVIHNTPLPTDPAEFFTFAITGLWALVVGLLILRGADLPRWLGYLSVIAGVDMILLFLADYAGAGTLILLTGGPASLILGPAMWFGFGRALLRETGAAATAPAGMGARGA